jgi:hypothetical protein
MTQKEWKAELADERARTWRFNIALDDTLAGATVRLGSFKSDGSTYDCRAGRLGSACGGYVIVTHKHAGQKASTSVYPAESFRSDPMRYLGSDGAMLANDVLCTLSRLAYEALTAAAS